MKATNKMNTKHLLEGVRTTKMKVAGLLAFTIALSSGINAAVIVSNDFSFGYGKNTTGLAWTLQSPTTPVTGNFTFTPTVTSNVFSAGGPLFTDRVLTTAGANQFSGNSDDGANPFTALLNFAYTGPTPADAAPLPNYRISLIIDSISIYGVRYNSSAGDTLAFSEKTVGHAATSSAITLNNVTSITGLQNATPYVKLVWNPEDYSIDGTSGLRSFGLVSESGRPIDGFEVFGRVQLTYDAIPEPSAMLLGVVGLTVILFFRKRKQLVP